MMDIDGWMGLYVTKQVVKSNNSPICPQYKPV